MAPEATGTPGGADVPARAHAVNQKVERVEAAQSAAKWTGRIITLLLVVVILGGLYIAVGMPLQKAYSERDTYVKALQDDIQEKVAPRLQEEFRLVVNDLRPDLDNVVMPRLRDEWLPRLQDEGAQEVYTLVQNLEPMVRELFATTAQNITSHAETRLKKDIPALQDQNKTDAAIENVQKALNNVVDRVVSEHLNEKVETLVAIETKVENFPVPDTISKLDDDALRMHMRDQLTAYVALRLSGILTPEAQERLGRSTNR